jgi:hypothetical protein
VQAQYSLYLCSCSSLCLQWCLNHKQDNFWWILSTVNYITPSISWFLDSVPCLVFRTNTSFRKLDLFPSSGENVVWTYCMSLTVSNGPDWCMYSQPSLRDGNRSSLQNVVFCSEYISWFLDSVPCLVFRTNTSFRKLDLFPSSGENVVWTYYMSFNCC